LKLSLADYWRYTLISIRPETKDTSFTWNIFLEKVNSDLNDALGNVIHRILTFINRYFGGVAPDPGNLIEHDRRILRMTKVRIERIAKNLENFRLQCALRGVTSLSRLGNKYLNDEEPWKTIKTDRQSAATTL